VKANFREEAEAAREGPFGTRLINMSDIYTHGEPHGRRSREALTGEEHVGKCNKDRGRRPTQQLTREGN